MRYDERRLGIGMIAALLCLRTALDERKDMLGAVVEWCDDIYD